MIDCQLVLKKVLYKNKAACVLSHRQILQGNQRICPVRLFRRKQSSPQPSTVCGNQLDAKQRRSLQHIHCVLLSSREYESGWCCIITSCVWTIITLTGYSRSSEHALCIVSISLL